MVTLPMPVISCSICCIGSLNCSSLIANASNFIARKVADIPLSSKLQWIAMYIIKINSNALSVNIKCFTCTIVSSKYTILVD